MVRAKNKKCAAEQERYVTSIASGGSGSKGKRAALVRGAVHGYGRPVHSTIVRPEEGDLVPKHSYADTQRHHPVRAAGVAFYKRRVKE
jgi:hypothetical protein